MTKVVNLNKSSYNIYIGRGSKWGNPFPITETESRKVVIDKYRDYLFESGLINDIDELEGKVLGCYCKPKDCHGDVLVELLEEIDF